MYIQSMIESEYKKKVITADNAAKLVKSGANLQFGLTHAATVEFDKALAKRAEELSNVTIYSTLPLRKTPFECSTADPEHKSFRFFCTHFSGNERKMCADGNCWFVPQNFHELPRYWAEELRPFDIFVARVGKMDKNGYFNIGPQVGDFWAYFRNSKIKILEVSDIMPYACGRSNLINIADIDYVIEGSDTPLAVLPDSEPTDIEIKIAENVLPLIKSGSCIQIGIGGLSNTIGKLICDSDIKDLSGHTEMLTSSYLRMFLSGKLTGNKNIDKGKLVYTFAGGTKELYDFIDHNEMLCCAPVEYVNSPAVIGSINNMVSINTCLNVDLFGQISAESSGLRQISGTGGQLDFCIGSYMSKGGKGILCLPSARKLKDGTLETNIVPFFKPGTVVTTPRSAVNYIATEYGIVNMKGRSTCERAELLVSIAHPQFRDALMHECEKMGIWNTGCFAIPQSSKDKSPFTSKLVSGFRP